MNNIRMYAYTNIIRFSLGIKSVDVAGSDPRCKLHDYDVAVATVVTAVPALISYRTEAQSDHVLFLRSGMDSRSSIDTLTLRIMTELYHNTGIIYPI
jgi:hypothetical protein